MEGVRVQVGRVLSGYHRMRGKRAIETLEKSKKKKRKLEGIHRAVFFLYKTGELFFSLS